MAGEDLAFTYFPTDYRWSHGMLLPLGGAPWRGGEIGQSVEVPYEGTSLPALFVHPAGARERAPALVFLDGFDVTKEIQYFTREEGGSHHCQVDNVSIGVAYMWDWLEEAFGC